MNKITRWFHWLQKKSRAKILADAQLWECTLAFGGKVFAKDESEKNKAGQREIQTSRNHNRLFAYYTGKGNKLLSGSRV